MKRIEIERKDKVSPAEITREHLSGGGNPSLLRYALSRWFPEPGVAHVTRAHQHVTYTQSGKINSAIGYITKERTPQAAWPKWQYRLGRPVLGKRYRISANLRAKPIAVTSGIKEPLRSAQGGQLGNKVA